MQFIYKTQLVDFLLLFIIRKELCVFHEVKNAVLALLYF